jgi:hypothetical protein
MQPDVLTRMGGTEEVDREMASMKELSGQVAGGLRGGVDGRLGGSRVTFCGGVSIA